MSTYLYESLSPERFQHLCQALLTEAFPNVQCFPVGQPDGGRDALLFDLLPGDSKKETYVFQVKFVRHPDSSDARDAVLDFVKRELPKIERLFGSGIAGYYFLTNVPASGHLEVGSIDRMNAALSNFGQATHCWWRNDLDRRLDASTSVKWSYPEVIRGSDLLQALLQGELDLESRRRSDAIQAYLVSQYSEDEKVKFKQVELQNRILDLFVDVPVRTVDVEDSSLNWSRRSSVQRLRRRRKIGPLDAPWLGSSFPPHEDAPDAAVLLMAPGTANFAPRIVLEGAPGQGKSTITQFVCQANRIRLLKKEHEQQRLPGQYVNAPVRLPLRVDLRDFAMWLGDRDPFSSDQKTRRPAGSSSSLESFLARQISASSGGFAFDVSDLTAIARRSPLLVVLDGFDEVADIPTRKRLVEEIGRAATRLQALTVPAQIVVTSRPAAFVNSPGFPSSEWKHLELLSLTHTQIYSYADKWMAARNLNEKERRETKGVLEQKLNQPHMRDLARNPMQLAILLALINTKGLSLPDKRTSLYDSYIDLFFSREAEKSEIIREHRELLVELHRYLAWVLQVEAEAGDSGGSVSVERLKSLLKAYLEKEGYETSLVDLLFQGMVERVVALVSRVQGTFEFEVQPLREYFAARHLYETAPYAPVGSERTGTKPERFQTLARNAYWLNATRFFCGCFSRGELASLADGLESLSDESEFSQLSHVRRLAYILLTDWVFAQQPISLRRVIAFLTREPGFRMLLAATQFESSSRDFPLADRCGRPEFLAACKSKFAKARKADLSRRLARVIAANTSSQERLDYWMEMRPIRDSAQEGWLRKGRQLGVLSEITVARACALAEELGPRFVRCLLLASRIDVFDRSPSLFTIAVDQLVETGGLHSIGFSTNEKIHSSPISLLSRALTPSAYGTVFDGPKENTLQFSIWMNRVYAGLPMADFQPLAFEPQDERALALIQAYESMSKLPIEDWRTSLDPWRRVVETGRSAFGESSTFDLVALISSAIRSKAERGAIGDGLFDQSIGLCDRARYARLQVANASFWRGQLDKPRSLMEQNLLFLQLLNWATLGVITELSEPLAKWIDSLSHKEFRKFHRDLLTVGGATGRLGSEKRVSKQTLLRLCSLSPRLLVLLRVRFVGDIAEAAYLEVLRRYSGEDPALLHAGSEVFLHRARENGSDWEVARDFVRRAYRFDGAYEPPLLTHNSTQMVVPIPTALRACESPEEYPLFFLSLAESALSNTAKLKVKKVGEISDEEGWLV